MAETRKTLAREVRVAFSRKAQPPWFRVTKWIVILGLAAIFWSTPYFWWWVGAIVLLSVAAHLFWRFKTRGWTRAWGGWRDVDAARDRD